MNRKDNKFGPSDFSTLKELCFHLCASLNKEERQNVARSVCNEVISSKKSGELNDSLDNDEFTITSNIEKQLISLNKGKDVARFRYLNKKLHRNEYSSLISNRQAILSFFLNVSEGKHSKDNELTFLQKTLSSLNQKLYVSPSISSPSFKGSGDYSDQSIFSHNGDSPGHHNSSIPRPTTLSNNIFVKRDAVLKTPPKAAENHWNGSASSYKSVTNDSLSILAKSSYYSKYKKTQVPESTVVKELLYCFQGIQGSLFKVDHLGGFTIDPQVRIPQRQMVESLMELGFLHNSVVSGCKSLEKGGTVAKAVHTAIRSLLTDYYGLIGSLYSDWVPGEKTTDDTPMSEEGRDEGQLTLLRRLYYFSLEPTRLLQTLCEAMHTIRNNRNTNITTALDILRHHGDQRYRSTITYLILHAGRPIINMIINWMVEGELIDPMGEFFIIVNTHYKEKDIWRDKFILRQDLIPNVMTGEQAEMILRSGKAVHFLNVICGKQTPITGSRKRLHNMKVNPDLNLLDLSDPRSELSETIAGIFVETSKQVLDTLINQFKLFQHFQGLRRYILLGQGDFANYYMELVEPEMRKPASQLQFHELMYLKSEAERATLARYEDPEILSRVSVKVLIASGGDSGSDVFGLQYLMHEPLDAALKVSEGAYSHMFNFLWRTKRMENILLRLRKERWATKNSLNWLACRVHEIKRVVELADRLSDELLHFAREFHYYILFEVVECLWEKFSHDFSKAKSFDDVITAHDEFTSNMQAKTFQTEDSRTFINELRLIWDLVLTLETLEETFFCHVGKEYSLRIEQDLYVEENGTCDELELKISESNQNFKSFLSNMRAQYSLLNADYQGILKKFLLELSSTKNHELRLLSSRIDYNEYYKGLDRRLTESMMYSRCSDLFN